MPESPCLFVLLHHCLPDGSHHWDLCLEQGDNLATWQLLENPAVLSTSPGSHSVPARRLRDHRRAYLEYEGPVGTDRGHVTRIDRGSWFLLSRRADCWQFRLAGSLLIGTYELQAGGDSGQPWRLSVC